MKFFIYKTHSDKLPNLPNGEPKTLNGYDGAIVSLESLDDLIALIDDREWFYKTATYISGLIVRLPGSGSVSDEHASIEIYNDFRE
jgi:hypothetical protein